MAARATWSGAIEFGGFPIHLRAYNLVRSRGADSFKTLCPCHQTPVVMPRMCAVDNVPVDLDACHKAVEQGKDSYLIIPPEGVDAIKDAEATKMLEIKALPPKASVPLHLALGHYRLTPDEKVAGSEKPAEILWNGLLGSERAVVTEWVTRAGSRNSLLAIHADVHGLNGTTLPYTTDFNDVPEFAFERNEGAEAMFEAFANQQGIDMGDFAHTLYVDSYAERRAEAIRAAVAGKPIEAKAAAPSAPAVPDLMAAMAAALEGAKAPAKKKPAAKPKAKAKA